MSTKFVATYVVTRINTAPFSTLITPGVVPIRLHTMLCFLVAYHYDDGDVVKTAEFESHFG